MSQKIFGLGLGATGIVGVLVVAGLILNITNVLPVLGGLAIFAGITIGILLGALGVLGVAKRLTY